MNIQILSTQIETKPTQKGSYQQLEVAYKNLTFGKVESKKLMSFGAGAEVFKTLATAAVASVWDIDVVKNDKGYNDWVKATKGTAASTVDSPSTKVTASPATQKGGWETPEERAKKQIYIVRQSSLSNAIATITVGRKSEVKPDEVIELAKQYEAYVFDGGDIKAVVTKDLGTIETIPEDIPW